MFSPAHRTLSSPSFIACVAIEVRRVSLPCLMRHAAGFEPSLEERTSW